MRIIAGKWRGKKLTAPAGTGTRPTSDRAKEMLFNILTTHLLKQGKNWDGLILADVFAGSGAIGAEALSRGAQQALFIENDAAALACLRQNTAGMSGAVIVARDATQPLLHAPVDIIFMDAPYGKGLWQRALAALASAGWIDDRTLTIIETDREEEETLPEGWRLEQRRSAGRNVFLFARLAPDGQ